LLHSSHSSLKKLLGGGAELQSLADLSAAQVKQLFDKLGIDTNSPFINAQMQGIYADTFYDEEVVEGEVSVDPSNPGPDLISSEESWAEALTWISELTEVQEDAIDDKIDICYEACSESHPMVFSFDADAEGFPELDMWVSSILRQGIDLNVADPQAIAKALEEEVSEGRSKGRSEGRSKGRSKGRSEATTLQP
jgi:hypothetical protein